MLWNSKRTWQDSQFCSLTLTAGMIFPNILSRFVSNISSLSHSSLNGLSRWSKQQQSELQQAELEIWSANRVHLLTCMISWATIVLGHSGQVCLYFLDIKQGISKQLYCIFKNGKILKCTVQGNKHFLCVRDYVSEYVPIMTSRTFPSWLLERFHIFIQ